MNLPPTASLTREHEDAVPPHLGAQPLSKPHGLPQNTSPRTCAPKTINRLPLARLGALRYHPRVRTIFLPPLYECIGPDIAYDVVIGDHTFGFVFVAIDMREVDFARSPQQRPTYPSSVPS
jgi:hypothetical protein